jgi:hypothetical protein
MSSVGPDLKRFPSKPSKATAGGGGGGGGKSTAATVSKSSNPFDDDDDENKDQGRHPATQPRYRIQLLHDELILLS